MAIPKRSFIFVRHGQTDWNVENRMQGQLDVPLNATGLQQAANICKILLAEHVDVIISSPLIRALKTASFIAETHAKPIHIDTRLQERGYGAYEGRLSEDVKRELGVPSHQPLSEVINDVAEPWPEISGRALAVVSDWLKANPRKKLVFVSHGVVFRTLAQTLTGQAIRANNAQPYLFRPTKKGWEITPL